MELKKKCQVRDFDFFCEVSFWDFEFLSFFFRENLKLKKKCEVTSFEILRFHWEKNLKISKSQDVTSHEFDSDKKLKKN